MAIDAGSSAQRARQLDQDQPNCCCEKVSVSPHSPGLVEKEEVLVRILVAPQHKKGNGRPRAAALTDAETIGLSVFRRDHATNEEIRSVAVELVGRARLAHQNKAGVFGVLEIPCRSFREFRWAQEEEACYCVYDTARETVISHAEAFQQIADTAPEIITGRRRDLFAQVEERFIPVSDFRGGLLADLAPDT